MLSLRRAAWVGGWCGVSAWGLGRLLKSWARPRGVSKFDSIDQLSTHGEAFARLLRARGNVHDEICPRQTPRRAMRRHLVATLCLQCAAAYVAPYVAARRTVVPTRCAAAMVAPTEEATNSAAAAEVPSPVPEEPPPATKNPPPPEELG
eukprot:6811019-Prymnesium_polylepis.1